MYNLARNGYTSAQIERMLKSNRSVSYKYELLSQHNVVLGLVTATGSIDYDATAKIKRAANLTIKEASDIDFVNDHIRPIMVLQTPTGAIEFPLGVFLMSTSSRNGAFGAVNRSVSCYDKAQILTDDKFTFRHNISAGTNYVSAIKQILASANIIEAAITPTELETETDIEFAIGTTKLDAINALLRAINYNDLWFSASGIPKSSPHVLFENRAPEFSYMTDASSVVMSGAIEDSDIFNAPNKIVRYLESADRACIVATATNRDPSSPISVISRGRTIVDAAAVDDIADQATLEAYVERLMSQQKIMRSLQFTTAVMPMHEDYDCLFVQNNELGIVGKYVEEQWSINLSVGGQMTHRVRG